MRRVKVDIERWEVLALDPLSHWCSRCKQVHEFSLVEESYTWLGHCGKSLLLQQLIIEGLLVESKYLGIEHA